MLCHFAQCFISWWFTKWPSVLVIIMLPLVYKLLLFWHWEVRKTEQSLKATDGGGVCEYMWVCVSPFMHMQKYVWRCMVKNSNGKKDKRLSSTPHLNTANSLFFLYHSCIKVLFYLKWFFRVWKLLCGPLSHKNQTWHSLCFKANTNFTN